MALLISSVALGTNIFLTFQIYFWVHCVGKVMMAKEKNNWLTKSQGE